MLVSCYPYFSTQKRILSLIYDYSQRTLRKPLEALISNLVLEVPMPSHGLNKVEFNFCSENFTLVQHKRNKLPAPEVDFSVLLDFSPSDVTLILMNMMLESKTVIFSDSKDKLNNFVNVLSTMIFPFVWNYCSVSLIPESAVTLLMGPSPAIVGINTAFKSDFLDDYIDEQDETDYYENMVLIDLDSFFTTVKPSEEYKKVSLPIIKTNSLVKKLAYLAENKEQIESLSNVVQNLFFTYLVSILDFYNETIDQSYLKTNSTEFEGIVKTDYEPKYWTNEANFVKIFIQTNIYGDFIHRKIFPKTLAELAPVALFEETINKKKNKKFKATFTESDLYDIQSTYTVPSASFDKEYAYDNIGIKESIIKGHRIGVSRNSNLQFGFYFFPILQYELLNPLILASRLAPNINLECEKVNAKLLNSFMFNNLTVRKRKAQRNAVLLLWLNLFSHSFKEQQLFTEFQMFNWLMEVVDKTETFDIKVVNKLFACLEDQGEIIKAALFKKLIRKGVYPSFGVVTQLRENIRENKKINRLFQDKKTGSFKFQDSDEDSVKTDLSKAFFSEKAEFKFDSTCAACEKEIDMVEVCV